MRVDGFSSAYLLDRTPRPGSAVTPWREAEREVEQRGEPTLASPALSQGLESQPQARRVEAAERSGELVAARPVQAYQEQTAAVGSQASRALMAYGATSSYTHEQGASEVLGLDLYA